MPTLNHNLQRWLVLTLAVASLLGGGCTESGIQKAYNAGLIGKGEAMALDSMAKNHQPQNLYGKVIDQNGQPVAGVDVEGNIELMNGWIVGKIEKHKTQTDAEGLFQFVRLKGASLSASISKPGYEIDYRLGRIAPVGGQSSPTNRLTYIMWKQRGGEPMKYNQIWSSVPCDGTVERFDFFKYKSNNTIPDVYPSQGDLTVTLTRNPLTLNSRNRHTPFDWSVTLAITNGGLLEFTNQPYPYEAPAEGYQSSITFNFPTNAAGWQYEFKRSYYFKSQYGKVYGRMTVDVDASRPESPTYFNAEIYANPGGSRNLEFDPSKQIMQ